MPDESQIYAAVGAEPFHELIERFYEGVESDPPLRALYPEDLADGKQNLEWFLVQRFGGPSVFDTNRGAPRLRMRHVTFAITPTLRDSWVRHMRAALEQVEYFAPFCDMMTAYFEDAATFLINTQDRPAAVVLGVRNEEPL